MCGRTAPHACPRRLVNVWGAAWWGVTWHERAQGIMKRGQGGQDPLTSHGTAVVLQSKRKSTKVVIVAQPKVHPQQRLLLGVGTKQRRRQKHQRWKQQQARRHGRMQQQDQM